MAHALLERETLSGADVELLLVLRDEPANEAPKGGDPKAADLVSIVVQLPTEDSQRH